MNGFTGDEFIDLLQRSTRARPIQLRSIGIFVGVVMVTLAVTTGHTIWWLLAAPTLALSLWAVGATRLRRHRRRATTHDTPPRA